MLMEIEFVSQASKERRLVSSGMDSEAASHFLGSLIAWGPTKILKEYIKLFKYSRERRKGDSSRDPSISENIRAVEISLQRRYLQTAARYLNFPIQDTEDKVEVSALKYEAFKDDSQDSLFSVSKMAALMARRTPLVSSTNEMTESDGSNDFQEFNASAPNSHPCLEAMAILRMMQGRYDLALKCFLAISACHSSDPLETFEKTALDIVNSDKVAEEDTPIRIGDASYDYVMRLIETQHLNQFLLRKEFLMSTDSVAFMPLFALLRLVGLKRLGDFLIEHCVSPDYYYDMTVLEADASRSSPLFKDQDTLRREPLPIDQVATQLQSSSALLHWYLHLMFTARPDIYVKFPTNAIPSQAVTSWHRRHFQLYVDFAGFNRDSSKVLAGTEPYKVEAKTTPLLSFLKAALPLGGVLPVDARRLLEIERSRDAIDRVGKGSKRDSDDSSSPTFALELAYIIENFCELTETEAAGILNLYLKGTKSVMLSVLFTQRQRRFSSMLWDKLIAYCLSSSVDAGLFGELLEAAALSGADLARLVESIPPGMDVEGLRPRLVAAVADYRMKLEIYTAAIAASSEEEITLMREIAHRSRRGVRYYLGKKREKSFAELIHEKKLQDEGIIGEKISEDLPTSLPKSLRTKTRRDHNYLAYSIPRR